GAFVGSSAYGLRHMAEHLRHAGRGDLLGQLLRNGRWHAARAANDPSGQSSQTDWFQLWAAVADRNREALAQEKPAPEIWREVECALAVASVNAVSDNLSAELLEALVASGFWNVRTALIAARDNPDVEEGTRALAALASHMD